MSLVTKFKRSLLATEFLLKFTGVGTLQECGVWRCVTHVSVDDVLAVSERGELSQNCFCQLPRKIDLGDKNGTRRPKV